MLQDNYAGIPVWVGIWAKGIGFMPGAIPRSKNIQQTLQCCVTLENPMAKLHKERQFEDSQSTILADIAGSSRFTTLPLVTVFYVLCVLFWTVSRNESSGFKEGKPGARKQDI